MTSFANTTNNQSVSHISTNHDDAKAQTMADISYQFDFSRFFEHLVDVSLTFTALSDAPQLWLPAWIPGSYLMREFARNITAVHYQVIDAQIVDSDKQSKTHRARKIDKNTWQLPAVQAGQTVIVEYEVYCYDLSVRTAYVDQQRLYGNFTSLALAVEGQEQAPVHVSLIVPETFFADKESGKVLLASGLDATHLRLDEQQKDSQQADSQHIYKLQAANYHELIDYPFEIAEQEKFDFIIHDNEHQTLHHSFYLSGKQNANLGRLQQDITQICQTYVDWLGDAPFDDYTFMTFASGQDYGGLEHINSTSLITPRNDLPGTHEPKLPSTDYQRFLGLCSHEYFHSWWVKTVRPDVMIDVDLRREAFTPLLWVFEGFTSYIDDFMLQASGVIDKANYLRLLAEQINRYYQTPGRGNQSVAESSFDAWIKLYRTDENTGNAGISYYNKGALVALCLDLILLKNSDGRYRLFDVVKAFYTQAKQNDSKRIGINSADMSAVIEQFMPLAEWEDFERRYVNGVEELPIEALLTANGVKIQANTKETADKHVPWGMRCNETPAGLKVNRVMRDSVAARAGISAHDVIIAIDGIKADNKQLASLINTTRPIECHFFRRDELLCVQVQPKVTTKVKLQDSIESMTGTVPPHKVSLRLAKGDKALETGSEHPQGEAGWETWLNIMKQ
ncbi:MULTISPECIES: PDZ domain-containing protein [unclassified Psychrobacter]|uniref:M61 family metallopeptidase n=1 Tax=unclassified Psychrobacter TaxID=196806 RepID=UPI0025B61561|nr:MULTISPECIES: PDZ domain-containing protein [unclassified Psychrobacter]MDN3452192.1 PDZ domain-containing protein [Psychrobacter sp. APC 3350]MDN3501251.1 PDZ domain-containing protein [Psychrobacter sp. 5A.1]